MEFSGTFIAVILEAIISFFLIKNSKIKGNYYLITYIFIIMLDFISEYVVFIFFNSTSYIDKYPSSFRFIKGPLLYLASRQMLNIPLGKRQWLHFIPFLIAFLFSITVFLTKGSTVFVNVYLWIFRLYPVYWGAYLVFTIFSFRQRKDNNYSFHTLYFQFLCFVLVMMLSFTLMTYVHVLDREIMRIIYTLSFCIQFAMLIKLSLSRHLAEERLMAASPATLESDIVSDLDPAGKSQVVAKYKTSVLTQAYIDSNNKKLIDLLRDQKIFTNEDLKLDDIAAALHISKNHLSQCISEGLSTTFYDLINKYRIEEFISLLHQNPERQISELYYACGFRSKATFYKYFKQEMGLNPNDYRKTILITTV